MLIHEGQERKAFWGMIGLFSCEHEGYDWSPAMYIIWLPQHLSTTIQIFLNFGSQYTDHYKIGTSRSPNLVR